MDEIGQKLRSARIEKGYTLDDLQQITKIQKRYLIAIEEGNFDALPGDFYVRAFIKQYAETVGLDSDALLNQFQQDIPDTKPQEYVEESPQSKKRATRAAENNPVNRIRRYLPQIIIAAVALVIIVGAYLVTYIYSRNNRETLPNQSSSVSISSTKDTSSSSKKSASSETSKSSSASSKKSAKKTKKSSKKLSVDVAAANGATQAVTVKNLPASGNKIVVGASSASAWVSVTVNGATTWQGSLTSGSNHTVALPAGTTSFSVRSGNAPVTTLKLNNTKVDISKGTSVVRTITFTSTAAATSASSSESGAN